MPSPSHAKGLPGSSLPAVVLQAIWHAQPPGVREVLPPSTTAVHRGFVVGSVDHWYRDEWQAEMMNFYLFATAKCLSASVLMSGLRCRLSSESKHLLILPVPIEQMFGVQVCQVASCRAAQPLSQACKSTGQNSDLWPKAFLDLNHNGSLHPVYHK